MTPRPPTRDRQVWRIALGLGVGGGLLSLLGALLSALGQRQGLEGLGVMGTGVLALLPLFFGGMTVLALRRMDEYGRQLHTRAASVAFLVVMVLCASLIALEPALHFHAPAWVPYTAGMLTWGLSAAVLAGRGGRA